MHCIHTRSAVFSFTCMGTTRKVQMFTLTEASGLLLAWWSYLLWFVCGLSSRNKTNLEYWWGSKELQPLLLREPRALVLVCFFKCQNSGNSECCFKIRILLSSEHIGACSVWKLLASGAILISLWGQGVHPTFPAGAEIDSLIRIATIHSEASSRY